MPKVVRYGSVAHVIFGPLLNKTLEVGGGLSEKPTKRLDVYLNFDTKGDHAGLKCYVNWWKLVFELNCTDTRHWDYQNNCFINEPYPRDLNGKSNNATEF